MKKIIYLTILFLQTAYGMGMSNSSPEVWPPQIVRWKLQNNKELIFIGVHHTNDLNSSTHQHIRSIFEEEKPDIYVMEGFCSSREGESPRRLKEKSITTCEGKGKCGENLYAAYLATRYGIKFIGADLSEKDQIPLLKQHGYLWEDVIFYLLVQQLPYFYRDGDLTYPEEFTPATWENMCNRFLQATISGWIEEEVNLTYQDFLRWWNDHFTFPLDMEKEFSVWEKGELYHEPNCDEDALFTRKIAFWFHKNRDDYSFNIIQEAVTNYTKVLVIYGSNHLRNQWGKLLQTFGTPSSKQIIE
ncbi:MAG: hypothetical protein K0R76_957 [Alphaproteobacteria bacterium]|jgi:hypothetical protein|nr:hypothetical protein [Alphaproteobacteria bacterium]